MDENDLSHHIISLIVNLSWANISSSQAYINIYNDVSLTIVALYSNAYVRKDVTQKWDMLHMSIKTSCLSWETYGKAQRLTNLITNIMMIKIYKFEAREMSDLTKIWQTNNNRKYSILIKYSYLLADYDCLM